MSLGTNIRAAGTVIRLAGDLGVPVDVLGGLFGGKSASLNTQFDLLRLEINEGFFTASQEAAIRRIQDAASTSRRAADSLNNIAATDEAKATALSDARGGLTDMSAAVMDVLNSPTIELTPDLVQEMYGALAFSLSVQINAASELLYGEKLNGVMGEGGFQAVKTQIQGGIDALKALEPEIISSYGDFSGPNLLLFFQGGVTSHGKFDFSAPHTEKQLDLVSEIYKQVLSEVLLPSDQDFGDQQFAITESEFTYQLIRNYRPEEFLSERIRLIPFAQEMNRVIQDVAFSTMTGLKVAPAPDQIGFYSWNEVGADPIGDLIAAAEETIGGRTRIAFGSDDVRSDGTVGFGDYLKGAAGNDLINGYGGDDYMQGEGGDDTLFGGEGNDRYVGGRGFDVMIDEGDINDIDVAVFDGLFEEYVFFDDTGTTGARILVVKNEEGDFDVLNDVNKMNEVDILRGIEFLKFDDISVEVSGLDLAPRDITAPTIPVILAISDGSGVSNANNFVADGTLIISGTAEANSFVTVYLGPIAEPIGTTKTDVAGEWVFDYGATTDLENGSYAFSASASDIVNNSSGRSVDFDVTVDKSLAETINSFGNDTFNGSDADNVILDAGGDNVVNGGGGNDRIGLLSGNNTVSGGDDNDLIVGGFDNDTLNGNAGNDVIIGDVSDYVAGADRINGGTGDDLLEGGGGADTFVFAVGDGADTIGNIAVDFATPANSTVTGADFESGIDTILLDGFGITTGAAALAKVTNVADVATFAHQGTAITFAGLQKADLSVDDFQFI